MRCAYGRDSSICFWALRILLAATFSIALVIFCMFFTEAILERISFSPATLIVLSGQIVAAQFERMSGPSSQIEGTLNAHRQYAPFSANAPQMLFSFASISSL